MSTEKNCKFSFCQTLIQLLTIPKASSKTIKMIKILDWVVSQNIPPANEAR